TTLAGGYYFYSQYTNYLQQPIELVAQSQPYEVTKGSSIRKVAKELEEQGVMKPALYFLALAKLNKQTSQLKAGEYKLLAGMKPTDVLKLITSGKAVQYKHTIIEGKTYKQLVASIKTSSVLKQTLTDQDYEQIMKKVGSDFPHPEGAFFADTYNFPKDTTDLDFLKRSHKMMKEKLKQAWGQRDPEVSIKTPYQALILASIVEKETGDESERSMIARVFINRLDKSMLLQTDPTVIYGMGDAYDGNIRKRDLTRDTSYNTYTRGGLTPTPIATPGKAAIDAVMHPAAGDVLFFVAKGDGSGSSYFSKTNADHNKAVAKYLRNLRKNK
ncbi:MAG: endolytic transglycosylase MltG, partial [Thiotrichaceae bacterium]